MTKVNKVSFNAFVDESGEIIGFIAPNSKGTKVIYVASVATEEQMVEIFADHNRVVKGGLSGPTTELLHELGPSFGGGSVHVSNNTEKK